MCGWIIWVIILESALLEYQFAKKNPLQKNPHRKEIKEELKDFWVYCSDADKIWGNYIWNTKVKWRQMVLKHLLFHSMNQLENIISTMESHYR